MIFKWKVSNPRSFTRKKKTSNVWIWIFVVLLLLLLWLGCWKIFGNHDWENVVNFDFSLGEEVYLQWEIKAVGYIITHTHTIDDINYGKIWIKSDFINLSDYAWFVQLTWIVEKFYQGNPIVNVKTLSGSMSGSGHLNVALNSDWWVYIVWAWIRFLPDFFDEYVLLNEWENWEIHIQNIESGKEIILKYFRCNSLDPSKNCKWLNEGFESNMAQSFGTSEWDVYYKNSEDNSRFVSNWTWWWVFIYNASDEEMQEKLKDLIKFANEKNMNEWIKSRAINICQWSWERLQKINNSEISLRQEWLIVTVSWNWTNKQMTCQILVDFGLPAKWKLLTLTIWDDVVLWDELENTEDDTLWLTWNIVDDKPISSTTLDTNVPQFPIKEEWLEYKSSRWGYSLKFPSSNISYSASSVKENFGRNDISCSYVINVIKYSEKENLETSPAIRIYECQWTVEKSWAPGIIVYPRVNKKFIVQMNDWAWNDFSMNLKFEPLTE